MPPLTRWFIKSSLLCLVLALAAGLWLAAGALAGQPALNNGLGPVYFHLFLVGWVSQLIFGVVYWMFPKSSPQKPRGSERLGWVTFWLLNVGLLLRVIGEPWLAAGGQTALAGGLLAASAGLQWLAGLAFVMNTWGRVKEK